MVFKEIFFEGFILQLGGKGNANIHQAFYGIIHHSTYLLTYNIGIFCLKNRTLDRTIICRIVTNNTDRVGIININTC